MTPPRALGALIHRLAADRGGNVITTFALVTPVIAILTLGGVDLASVSADKSKMQDVADNAALLAAKQLGMADNNGLSERTKAVMAEQLSELSSRMTYDATVTPDTEEGTVQVQLVANRNSFFANMLPPGGWNFTVTANAQQMGNMPLCVLSHGSDKKDEVFLEDNARFLAPGCLVHSNSDVNVKNSAHMSAGVVQAAGLATGAITPTAQTDAPPIVDPFASMTIGTQGGLCSPLDLVAEILPLILTPGVHCGNIKAEKGGSITLLPGEHYFQKGKLELKGDAQLTGDDVVLVFGKDADFKFTDQSQIRLRGRRQGAYAGFVVATTRDNNHEFEISSSAARELLGTVYIPGATLLVKGKDPIADQSAWTVIVAKGIKMRENPNLVINKNYAGSSVPVPGGVGDKVTNAEVRLTQ
ncbi:MAG: pilus assembly protein [Caulobacteraceae bacterium]|nr:MAG: pilus assembly protein [Caulobacteraceae bacterium]